MRLCRHPLLWVLAFACRLTLGVTYLEVGVPVNAQTIRPGEKHNYEILGMSPSSTFEVKLSYPATMPANFEVVWGSGSDRAPPRRLSDDRKEMFRTDESGHVAVPRGPATTAFALTAVRESFSYDPVHQSESPIVYNIAVAPVMFGVPTEAFPLIATGVCCIGFAWITSRPVLEFLLRSAKAAKVPAL